MNGDRRSHWLRSWFKTLGGIGVFKLASPMKKATDRHAALGKERLAVL